METSEMTPTTEISTAIYQAFVAIMDQTYTLVDTNPGDSYTNDPTKIQDCIDQRDAQTLHEDEWIDDASYEQEELLIAALQTKLLSNTAYAALHPYIDDWIEDWDHRDTIRAVIRDRDNSNPVQAIIDRSTLRARVSLYTNYEALPHNDDMNNCYAYQGYFKDIVDLLYLNPAKLKQCFHQRERTINTSGGFPNLAYRNGKEAVDYAAFAQELENQSTYALLTFVGMLPLSQMYAANFQEPSQILIPKGNSCGLFSHWQGGGSLLGITLLRDLIVPVNNPKKTIYDRCEICVDEARCGAYCIDEVYGLHSSFWGHPFKLIYP